MGNAPNGMTRREKLVYHPELIPSQEIDPEFVYMINWFWELRGYLGGYEIPLTPVNVREFISDKYPSPDECDTLLAMDRAYRAAMTKTVNKYIKERAEK